MKFTKANHHTFDNDVIITSKELRSGINTVLITYIYIEKFKKRKEKTKGRAWQRNMLKSYKSKMRRTTKIKNCSTHLNKGNISEKHIFTGKCEN